MSIAQLLAPLAAALAALLAATDRKIERVLRGEDATAAERAVLVPHRTPFTALRLKRLAGVGAIHAAGDRHYIDEDGWRRWRSMRRRRALTILAVLGVALCIVWAFGRISFR